MYPGFNFLLEVVSSPSLDLPDRRTGELTSYHHMESGIERSVVMQKPLFALQLPIVLSKLFVIHVLGPVNALSLSRSRQRHSLWQ